MSTFVLATYHDLQADQTDTTNQILLHISLQLAGLTISNNFVNSTTPAFLPKPFATTHSSITINTLWSCSLLISLITASLGILVKQWFHEFMAQGSHDPQYRIRIRFFRNEGLERWQVFEIAAVLPLLLQVSLFLFLVGLSLFLHNLNHVVGWITTGISLTWLQVFLFTTLAPVVSSQCPYKIPILKRALYCFRPKIQSVIYNNFSKFCILVSAKLYGTLLVHSREVFFKCKRSLVCHHEGVTQYIWSHEWLILPSKPRNWPIIEHVVAALQPHYGQLTSRLAELAHLPLAEEGDIRKMSEIDMDLLVLSDPFFLDDKIKGTLMECIEELRVLDIFTYHNTLDSHSESTETSHKASYWKVRLAPEAIPTAKSFVRDALMHRSRHPKQDTSWFYVFTSVLAEGEEGAWWNDFPALIVQLTASESEDGATIVILAVCSSLSNNEVSSFDLDWYFRRAQVQGTGKCMFFIRILDGNSISHLVTRS